MTNKKGAVSTNTIVYLAIGVFVLVLVFLWLTGLGGQLINKIMGDPVDSAKSECKSLCAEAKTDLIAWTSSSFCTKAINVGDTDGDGSDNFAKCWEDPINRKCGAKKFISTDDDGDSLYTVYFANEEGCGFEGPVDEDRVSELLE